MKQLQKIWLHLGVHKTGSTSIQWFFYQNAALLQREGIFYPMTGRHDLHKYGHHLLPWSVLENEDCIPDVDFRRIGHAEKARLWSTLAQEIRDSGCSNVVISSEEFDVLSLESIKKIGHHLSEFQVIPVLFIRNYADLLESAYRTAVIHSGYIKSISHLADHCCLRMDCDQMAKDWATIGVDGRLIVVDYDSPSVRSDVVATFISSCFASNEKILEMVGESVRKNESHSAFHVEIARFLRSKGVDEQTLRRWLAKAPKNMGDTDIKYRNSPNKLRRTLIAKYKRDVCELRSAIGSPSSFVGDGEFEFAEDESVEIRNVVEAILAMA